MENEMRLIDANALRQQMFSYYSCVNENSSKEYYKGETLMTYEVADMIEDCIDNAPTVDAVPVVRCKDCKHWEDGYFGYCTKTHTAMDYDAFCAYGERRNDGV